MDRDSITTDEEDFMLEALEAGADDVEADDDSIDIYTEQEQFETVLQTLQQHGYEFQTAEITMIPETTVTVSDDDAQNMLKLIDMLEDYDDVQEVYHNLEFDDRLLEM